MTLSYSVPTSLEYFASLVQSDDHFPLLEAAASLAQDEYPELDVQQLLGDVDQLLARLKRRLPADAPSLQRLRTLNLNAVLRTRRGIPISLAVVWMELAQGLGLHARGIAFPGHFMVKVLLPKGQVVLDPITGQSLSREELAERLEPYRRGNGLVDDYEVPLGLYLQAASPRDIIARMLRNLKEVHRTQHDWHRLVAVLDRLIVLLPQAWGERRDRGLAHAERGDSIQAVADLEAYLDNVEDGLDVDLIADRLSALRGGRY
jgi:regulator of sirC expression with transglutaminase-like and TPR domain